MKLKVGDKVRITAPSGTEIASLAGKLYRGHIAIVNRVIIKGNGRQFLFLTLKDRTDLISVNIDEVVLSGTATYTKVTIAKNTPELL